MSGTAGPHHLQCDLVTSSVTSSSIEGSMVVPQSQELLYTCAVSELSPSHRRKGLDLGEEDVRLPVAKVSRRDLV